jgi:hypothetical protein
MFLKVCSNTSGPLPGNQAEVAPLWPAFRNAEKIPGICPAGTPGGPNLER